MLKGKVHENGAGGLKGANTGSPQKFNFCGVKSPFKKFFSLSSYEGERDKG